MDRIGTSMVYAVEKPADVPSAASERSHTRAKAEHGPVRLSNDTRIHLEWSKTPDAVEDAYAEIGEDARPTVFQSLAWARGWLAHVNVHTDDEPLFVVGRNDGGALAFIWPLAIGRTMGARVLRWLGQSHFAMNAGYFASDIAGALNKSDLLAIFRHLRRQGVPFDALELCNQPEYVAGLANPMLRIASQPAPNANYERRLHADFETLYRGIFSVRARRNHKRQCRRLSELGEVTVSSATSRREREEVLETFFNLKAAQLDAVGAKNPFDQPGVKDFYRRLLIRGRASGALEAFEPRLCGLRLDGRLIATLIGVEDDKRFTTLMSAITMDEPAKAAPGQQLLECVIRDLCESGLEIFDFGPGASTQKLRWQMAPKPLFHTIVPLMLRARPATWKAKANSYIMRRVKNSPRAFALLATVREKMAGK